MVLQTLRGPSRSALDVGLKRRHLHVALERQSDVQWHAWPDIASNAHWIWRTDGLAVACNQHVHAWNVARLRVAVHDCLCSLNGTLQGGVTSHSSVP